MFLSSAFDTILSSLGGVFGSHSVNRVEIETEVEEVDFEMDSRAVVPDQPKVGEGKQKNATESNGGNGNRNRRVLRDIGNLVTIEEAKGFGAQVLAKAQPQVEKNKCKKDTVRVILPDEEEAAIHKSSSRVKKVKSQKGRKSLTAILTARSKAVICNIDAADADDELAAVEYVEDIYDFYKKTERDGRVDDYMASQPEITSKMRAILVDWLIEVHNKFDLMPETLYLTINIIDRFLALETVSALDFQLVGLSSMLVASKYEEIWAPEVSELVMISDNADCVWRERVLVMEKSILGKLEWYLTVPTPYVFLTRYIKAATASDKEMENMAFFYGELALMSYSTIVHYSPSELSAAAVYAARCTLNRTPFWTPTLEHYTAYSEDHLLECAKKLVGLHFRARENKVDAVYRKYSSLDREGVALFPPAPF